MTLRAYAEVLAVTLLPVVGMFLTALLLVGLLVALHVHIVVAL